MSSDRPQDPAEFDAAELELIRQHTQLSAQAEQIIQAAHHAARDTRSYSGGFGQKRVVSWQLTDEEAITKAGMTEQLAKVEYGIKILADQVNWCEDFYRANPWTRYFPCLNRDGHIHSSERGCPTVRFDTDMSWAVALSGKSVAEAVAELGETLCSVCFPEAPAEWCRTRSEVTRAERQAAKAAKDAARAAEKAVKELAQPFVTYDRERVTTVAAAKAVIRKPAETQVELEWHRSEDARKRFALHDRQDLADRIARIEHRLEMERADAVQVSYILIDREFASSGTGWSQADQDKAVAATLKRARREYFR
jgi:hypothetical protein